MRDGDVTIGGRHRPPYLLEESGRWNMASPSRALRYRHRRSPPREYGALRDQHAAVNAKHRGHHAVACGNAVGLSPGGASGYNGRRRRQDTDDSDGDSEDLPSACSYYSSESDSDGYSDDSSSDERGRHGSSEQRLQRRRRHGSRGGSRGGSASPSVSRSLLRGGLTLEHVEELPGRIAERFGRLARRATGLGEQEPWAAAAGCLALVASIGLAIKV